MRLYFLTSISGLTSLQALKTFCYIFKAFFFQFYGSSTQFFEFSGFFESGKRYYTLAAKDFYFCKCEHKGKSFKVETSSHVMLANVIENK